MNNILKIKNLNTYIIGEKKRIAVSEHIDLQLKRGEILGIIGESGAGKTMTALSLSGLIPIRNKSVCDQYLFDGKEIDLKNLQQLQKIRAKGISYIFQEPFSYLNPVLTIGEQIAESILYNLKKNKKEAKKNALGLLRSVELTPPEEYYNRFPHQLSGGMNQRAMIALAIASHPQILIADEPTSALDVTIKYSLIELIRHLTGKLKITVIWITHDIALIKDFVDRIAVMYAGRIVEEGATQQIYHQPAHPYTQALLKCLPEKQLSEKNSFLKGEPPDLSRLPKGCKFNTRCPYAFKECFQQEPGFFNAGQEQKAKCFLLRKI